MNKKHTSENTNLFSNKFVTFVKNKLKVRPFFEEPSALFDKSDTFIDMEAIFSDEYEAFTIKLFTISKIINRKFKYFKEQEALIDENDVFFIVYKDFTSKNFTISMKITFYKIIY